MRCKNPESIRYGQVAAVVEELYKCYTEDYVCVIREVYKRIRTPRFYGNDAHASTVVPRPFLFL